MVEEYYLDLKKIKYIINGEILNYETRYEEPKECIELFKKIEKYDRIVLSFGRAEKYKNLESTMLLGKK